MKSSDLEKRIIDAGSAGIALGLLAIAKAINAWVAWQMVGSGNRSQEFLQNVHVVEERQPK